MLCPSLSTQQIIPAFDDRNRKMALAYQIADRNFIFILGLRWRHVGHFDGPSPSAMPTYQKFLWIAMSELGVLAES